MHILVIGGGLFLGAAVVDSALACGHAVTVFNRGRSRSEWPAGVEAIVGDRSGDLGALAGRRFDAIVDSCGYVPADIGAIAAALAPRGRYCFVSSISAYASFATAPVRETDALLGYDGIAPDDRDRSHYGAQKAACEDAVQATFGAQALIVRPGLIVGPGDRSGRFSYWPWRALAGGDMLVPDMPPGDPIQVVDVRDLADVMLGLIESHASGVFNATGPVPDGTLDWPTLIERCLAAASRRGAPATRIVRVAEDFLVAEGVAPWTELPVWIPTSDASEKAHSRVDCSRIAATGFVTRPIDATIEAELDAAATLVPDDPRRRGKLTAKREAGLIARWLARGDATTGRRQA